MRSSSALLRPLRRRDIHFNAEQDCHSGLRHKFFRCARECTYLIDRRELRLLGAEPCSAERAVSGFAPRSIAACSRGQAA